MTPPDENDPFTEELVAYLDGELEADRTEAVEAKIGQDAQTREQARELKRTWDLLDHLPRPEASANFTERTMERLAPALSATFLEPGKPIPLGSTQISSPVVRPQRRMSWITAALCIIAAGIVGYGGHAAYTELQARAVDGRIIAERRLFDRMPMYRDVDDYAFLEALDHPDLFGDNGGQP